MCEFAGKSLITPLILKKGTDVKSLEKKLPAFAAKTIAKEMGVTDYKMELQPLTSIHLYFNIICFQYHDLTSLPPLQKRGGGASLL